ncbi:hypothetical protein IFM89_013427, partial [Coptis chinensis]
VSPDSQLTSSHNPIVSQSRYGALDIIVIFLSYIALKCKYQLAARLVASIGACVEVNVSDEQLVILLSKL